MFIIIVIIIRYIKEKKKRNRKDINRLSINNAHQTHLQRLHFILLQTLFFLSIYTFSYDYDYLEKIETIFQLHIYISMFLSMIIHKWLPSGKIVFMPFIYGSNSDSGNGSNSSIITILIATIKRVFFLFRCLEVFFFSFCFPLNTQFSSYPVVGFFFIHIFFCKNKAHTMLLYSRSSVLNMPMFNNVKQTYLSSMPRPSLFLSHWYAMLAHM